MVGRENLNLFSQVKAIAQQVNNVNFKREYQKIITPIEEKHIENNIKIDDETLFEVNAAVCKIHHLAITYQFVPNHAHKYRDGRAKSSHIVDYSDHGKLFELEKFTEYIIFGQHIA